MISKIADGELLLGRDRNSDRSMTVVIILLTLLVCFFVFFAFIPISGQSMENTIYDKQYCFILRKWYTVSRGDIVTINTSDTKEEHTVIKRVIGLGGDKIVFMASKDGKFVDLYICKAGEKSFKKQNEPYIKERMKTGLHNIYEKTKILTYTFDFEEQDINDLSEAYGEYIINIPKDHVYFLGDNRNVSNDSRHYGALPLEKVTSKVLSVVY